MTQSREGKAVSFMDEEFYRLAREHINQFLGAKVSGFVLVSGFACLEIGPPAQRRDGMIGWSTLDITPGCTYQADITKRTSIADSTYDAVLCMEVLEHTLQPFDAVAEIRRILKPGGILLASSPLNFRIHGPANDCWRFTEHGIKALMRDFDDLEIDILETPDRFLFPIHYCWSGRCNKTKSVADADVSKTFRFIA